SRRVHLGPSLFLRSNCLYGLRTLRSGTVLGVFGPTVTHWLRARGRSGVEESEEIFVTNERVARRGCEKNAREQPSEPEERGPGDRARARQPCRAALTTSRMAVHPRESQEPKNVRRR